MRQPSTFGERTEDNTLGTRVRAAFVNTREIAFNSIDIVTERRTIYLMGAVTQKEADVAAHVASRVPGVKQVVKLFDVAAAGDRLRRAAQSPQQRRRRSRPRPRRPRPVRLADEPSTADPTPFVNQGLRAEGVCLIVRAP